ncbi:hypothetical protein RHSIM_Rhsim12G0022400 [Rhododendron simsii]|uniref:Uncharacterized protein n=1 Tax=Rhododendron simsii TaxID=118357 RepID=A0A834L9G0_RHOSS|nr:hypothetical protein RHSIM_Rhsim12G0022400 [Rhododendron simsii]
MLLLWIVYVENLVKLMDFSCMCCNSGSVMFSLLFLTCDDGILVYWNYHFIAHASNASYQHWQQMGRVSIVENMLTDGSSKNRRSNSCGTARGHGML